METDLEIFISVGTFRIHDYGCGYTEIQLLALDVGGSIRTHAEERVYPGFYLVHRRRRGPKPCIELLHPEILLIRQAHRFKVDQQRALILPLV